MNATLLKLFSSDTGNAGMLVFGRECLTNTVLRAYCKISTGLDL